MSDTTRPLPAGAKPRGDDFNRLRARIESQRLTGAAGLLASGFSGGSTLAALGLPPVIRRTPVGIIPPWFLTGTVESGTAKININPGLVNNFVPTIGGVSLGAFPRPTLTVTGSVGVIEIKATIDGAGTITAVIVQNVATATADTVTNKYKTIGGWTFASGAFTSVTSILNTNQTLYLCNGTAIWES